MIRDSSLRNVLGSINLSAEKGFCCRYIPTEHMTTGISGIGSKIEGGRYNAKSSFEVLYISDTMHTASLETGMIVIVNGRCIQIQHDSKILLSVSYDLRNILDLTDPKNQKILRTNEQELTGVWRMGQSPPTQRLGRIAYETCRISALKVPSARCPGAFNFAVFNDRVATPEKIKIIDSRKKLFGKLPS
jgi:RES domain-containing protein